MSARIVIVDDERHIRELLELTLAHHGFEVRSAADGQAGLALVTALPAETQADVAKKLAALLEKEGVALDIGGYRDAPPGLRIWCGATVETDDLIALTPWLDWAFAEVLSELLPA